MGLRILPWALQVLGGVLLAGVVMGLIVPATGGAVSPRLAAAVTLLCVLGVLLAGRWFGRRESRGRDASP